MKSGHLIILGSAVAGCSAALAIYLAVKGGDAVGVTPQAAARSPKPVPVDIKRHAAPSAGKPAAAREQAPSSAKSPAGSGETSPAFRILGKPPAGRLADEREWFANAERIERQANRELANLRETLELTPNQEQRIFDTLARNSPSWLPGMMTGGSYGVGVVADSSSPASRSHPSRPEPSGSKPAASGPPALPDAGPGVSTGDAPATSLTDEVLVVLDYDQQQALIQEELNRRAWWEEVLPQLLPPDFPAAGPPDDGDSKVYEGPAGLLEE